MMAPVEFVEGRPVSVQLPDVVEVRIADTAPPAHQQQGMVWRLWCRSSSKART